MATINIFEKEAFSLIGKFFNFNFKDATIRRGQNKTQVFKSITDYYFNDEFDEKKKRLEKKTEDESVKEELAGDQKAISDAITEMLKAYKETKKVKEAWKAVGESGE